MNITNDLKSNILFISNVSLIQRFLKQPVRKNWRWNKVERIEVRNDEDWLQLILLSKSPMTWRACYTYKWEFFVIWESLALFLPMISVLQLIMMNLILEMNYPLRFTKIHLFIFRYGWDFFLNCNLAYIVGGKLFFAISWFSHQKLGYQVSNTNL